MKLMSFFVAGMVFTFSLDGMYRRTVTWASPQRFSVLYPNSIIHANNYSSFEHLVKTCGKEVPLSCCLKKDNSPLIVSRAKFSRDILSLFLFDKKVSKPFVEGFNAHLCDSSSLGNTIYLVHERNKPIFSKNSLDEINEGMNGLFDKGIREVLENDKVACSALGCLLAIYYHHKKIFGETKAIEKWKQLIADAYDYEQTRNWEALEAHEKCHTCRESNTKEFVLVGEELYNNVLLEQKGDSIDSLEFQHDLVAINATECAPFGCDHDSLPH